MKTTRCLAVVAIMLLAIPTARADDIVLGMSAAFTGPSRGLGIELYRGSMAYFEHINQAGGIHGHKIVIKAYDDHYEPLPAIENTVKLVEKDKVFLLYGYVGTPTVTRVLPLLKLYEDRSTYLFFPFTGAQPQRQPPYDRFVFNLRASYQHETEEIADNFVKIGRTRIAMFYQIDAFGRGGWDGVRQALKKRNLKVVAEATYRRGSQFSDSYQAQVALLQKASPDAIICVGSYGSCAGFARDARDAGLDVPIANVSFVGSESLIEALVEAGKAGGKDYTRDLINCQVVPSYLDEKLPAAKEYRELMQKHKPMPPAELLDARYRPLPMSYVSFEGFLDAKLLVEVLRKAGPELDKKSIRAAAESIHDFDLGIGTSVTFGKERHQGIDTVYFTTVDQGRFVRLTDWTRWRQ